MEAYMIYIWATAFVISIIAEAATQELVSIWFSLGSIVALILSFFAPFWVEIVAFVLVSFISLIATRPLVNKFMARTERYTNSDEVIGQRYKAESDITKFEGGEIKINGILYKAILMENIEDTILKDSTVEVVAFKGNKVVVKGIER